MIRISIAAKKLKDEGMRSGVWDVFVPWQANDRGGLWIEFKAGKNKLSAEQIAFRDALINQYEFFAAWDWISAARAVHDYLKLNGEKPQ